MTPPGECTVVTVEQISRPQGEGRVQKTRRQEGDEYVNSISPEQKLGAS